MAEEKKHIEHLIHGSVPREEWRKFIKQHFTPVTGGVKSSGENAAASNASDICASLGCPSSFHGGTLHHCSVDVEADGSTTIHYTMTAKE
jgi:hypothetical protein